MSNEYKKKSPEELDEYLNKFRKRGFIVPNKKGKGSKYSRAKQKKELFKDE